MPWYRDTPYFPKSKPRATRGGIKSKSKRGAFGESWWAKRWIQVLEGFNVGARLGRGRSYARSGQVLSINIEPGAVNAKVQGSRARPYQITLKVKTLSRPAWKKLAGTLSGQAFYAAKLLGGNMPEDIEEAFHAVGLSMFPDKSRDLKTDCSCPDWSNPCKHIAAVYYLLGEEFDRDPFLIFKLRGMERTEFLALIGAESARGKAEPRAPSQAEPLPTDPALFWATAAPQHDTGGEVIVTSVSASLPKRLGNFPFWRGEERFLSALESVYSEASPFGLDVFLAESHAREKRR